MDKLTPRLEVFPDRSVLWDETGKTEFLEGLLSAEAEKRLNQIRKKLSAGFLEKIIVNCKKPDADPGALSETNKKLLDDLVNSLTSEVGRAIVGLTILQLSIKSVCSKQSIRLHKGGGRGESFSWRDGLPMRVLDKEYNTPILRKYDLLKINADGVFMTRSLAENYPYSKLYKAASRGAKNEWIEIVDLVESGKINPIVTLKHLIILLINKSDTFKKDCKLCMTAIHRAVTTIKDPKQAIRIIKEFVESSTYSARLFEIAMHSLFQVLEDLNGFGDLYLKQLSQMRSANKKHGNIGDIELCSGPINSMSILESWDAKYGKPYLRDELEEISEKLSIHPETRLAGFVVDSLPSDKIEIQRRINELEEAFNVKIRILSFEDWALLSMDRTDDDKLKVAKDWIVAFAECLCQARRTRAPIDEPADSWVKDLTFFAQKL